jgi:hypothetical protein
MRFIEKATDKDYKTLAYRENYAHYILNNLNAIKEKLGLRTYWDICIGQFKVDDIWPWSREIYKMDLETEVDGSLTKDMLHDKIHRLFENKGHKLETHKDGERVYFNYTPSKGGGGMFKTNIDFSLFDDGRLSVKTWARPLCALQHVFEFSDALGLKTRPFSKTPKPVKINDELSLAI